MKIAIVSDFFYPELSGVTDSITLAARELARQGHEVLFVVPKYSRRDYAAVNHSQQEDYGPNIKIKRLPAFHDPSSLTGQGRVTLPLGFGFFALKKFAPDIIHTNSPFGPGLEAFWASRSLGVPLIGTNHTPFGEFMKGRTRFLASLTLRYVAWYYNRCRFISAPCSSLLKEMQDYGFRQPNQVVPNPIELSKFAPVKNSKVKKQLKERFGLTAKTIIYTGRLAQEKHVEVIIQALAIVRKTLPDISLALTGHGAAELSLKTLALELGLAKRVKFLGFLDLATLVLLYQASDIFAIMSVAESQSLSLMQAMATGLPVIGARARALPEYISRKSGFTVPPGDAEELAKVLIRLFNDKELAAKLGQGGLVQVKNYGPAVIVKEWEKIYNRARVNYG